MQIHPMPHPPNRTPHRPAPIQMNHAALKQRVPPKRHVLLKRRALPKRYARLKVPVPLKAALGPQKAAARQALPPEKHRPRSAGESSQKEKGNF